MRQTQDLAAAVGRANRIVQLDAAVDNDVPHAGCEPVGMDDGTLFAEFVGFEHDDVSGRAWREAIDSESKAFVPYPAYRSI